jgi:hypothetical protein
MTQALYAHMNYKRKKKENGRSWKSSREMMILHDEKDKYCMFSLQGAI